MKQESFGQILLTWLTMPAGQAEGIKTYLAVICDHILNKTVLHLIFTCDIYIYIYTYTHIYIYIYMHIHMFIYLFMFDKISSRMSSFSSIIALPRGPRARGLLCYWPEQKGFKAERM